MKYAIEMGSGAMIYIPNLIKIVSGIQNFVGEHTDTHTEHGVVTSLLLFFNNKESMLKTR
jgi:hypothetical protein